MSEKESAPMAPIFQYSGHSDDEHECSDQEPWELDEEEGDVVVQEEESSVDGILCRGFGFVVKMHVKVWEI